MGSYTDHFGHSFAVLWGAGEPLWSCQQLCRPSWSCRHARYATRSCWAQLSKYGIKVIKCHSQSSYSVPFRGGHFRLFHAISTVMSVDTSIQRTATNITIILACCMGHAHVICAVPLPGWSKYARYVSVRLAAPFGPPQSDLGRFLRAY